jgi:catechol 2,3-dioxygenase-like lactoylglutathione lyase family enzyme
VTGSGRAAEPPHRREPSAGAVHHIAVNVSDLERSVRFYSEVLGLRTTLRMELAGEQFEQLLRLAPETTGRVAYVQGSERVGQIELIEWSLPPSAAPTPPPPPPGLGFAVPGLRLLSFAVSEPLEFWHARFTDYGVPCWSEPVRLLLPNYGEIDAMVAEDPDGYLIEVVRLPSDEEVHAFRNA